MIRDLKRIKDERKTFLDGIGVPERTAFVADRFQLDAIESLSQGLDTLVSAPTGAGKTFIAVEAIQRVVAAGGRAVYTAPLKALSNAKYAEFKQRFEPRHSVGLLTGDRKIEGNADIVVATTEIYRNELYGYSENYALVVLDEIHYLADPQRGPVWEESIILSPRSSTLLMLSASISNAREIADWIEEVRQRPVSIIAVKERPVELRFGFLHPELGVLPLEDDRGKVFPEVAQFYGGADFGKSGLVSRRAKRGPQAGSRGPRGRGR